MNIANLPKLAKLNIPDIFSVDIIKEYYKETKIKDIQFQQEIINELGEIDFYCGKFNIQQGNDLWAKVSDIDWEEIYQYGIDFEYLTENPTENGLYIYPAFWAKNWIPYQSIQAKLEITDGMKCLTEYITERLGQSLDGNDLLKQLFDHFGKENFYDYRVIKKYHIDFKCDYDLREDNWFKSLINFYNYKCKLNGNDFHLQARKGENANDMIYKTGYCLHITNKSSAQKIEREGLIPKKKKDIHGNRVYVFSLDINNENDIDICIKFIYNKRLKSNDTNIFIDNDIVIFKIDLNKLSDDEKPIFYYDPSFSGSRAVYCERMIPPKCIIDKIEIKESDLSKEYSKILRKLK